MVDRQPARPSINTPASAPEKTTATTKSKENSYTKPRVGKCYRCEEPGHRSNKCLKRKQINMANYEDDGEEEVKIE